jgi:Wzt-like putative exopolysaccharide export protein
VRNLCNRLILLEKGTVRMVGSVQDGINAYLSTVARAEGQLNLAGRRFAPSEVEIRNAWMERGGTQTCSVQHGESIDLILHVRIHHRLRFSLELVLRQQEGIAVAFAGSGLVNESEIDRDPGDILVRCRLPAANLAAGKYLIDLICAETGLKYYDYVESGLTFEVEGVAIGKRHWAFNQSAGVGSSIWDVDFGLDRIESVENRA